MLAFFQPPRKGEVKGLAHVRPVPPCEDRRFPSRARTESGAALVALSLAGRASWSQRSYASLAREGVMQNAIAYRCVRMIARPPPRCRGCSMTARPRSTPIRCCRCWRVPTPRRTAARCSSAGMPSSNAPAIPISRRCRWAAKCASCTCCVPTACARSPARAAAPAPMPTPSTAQDRDHRAGGATASCRCCMPGCSIRSTMPTASRRSRRRRAPSTCTMPAANGPRRCSTTRPGLRARWSTRARTTSPASPTTSSSG